MKRLRIRNWDSLYENNRSRALKRLDWVPIPNAMDGLSYVELIDHPNGAAHFGAWIAIVEIASRQDIRGTIPHHSAGIAQALARISRIPAGIFEEALPRLVTIGWIEEYQQVIEIQQVGAGKPQASAGFRQEGALKGREGNEGKGSEADSLVEQTAERMYALHPKKKNKPLVELQLVAIANKGGDLGTIEACHKLWCATEAWNEKDGQYAPKLDEWLSDEGYTKRPREPTDDGIKLPTGWTLDQYQKAIEKYGNK